MLIKCLFWAGFSLFLTGSAAWADTDYRCLNQCVSNGRTASVCLPACTYNVSAAVVPKANLATGVTSATVGVVSSHRLLPEMQHIDTGTVLLQSKKLNDSETKDYKCIAQCLQASLRYQMCQEDCTAVTTKTGDKLIGGTNPSQILPFNKDK